MPEQDHDSRRCRHERCVGALRVAALLTFWGVLAVCFVFLTAVGMGRMAFHEFRHEIRRRRKL